MVAVDLERHADQNLLVLVLNLVHVTDFPIREVVSYILETVDRTS